MTLNTFTEKFREVASSVLPMVGVVLVIQLLLQPVTILSLARFIVGVVFMLLGLPLFLIGVDLSVERMGDLMSHYFINRKLQIVTFTGIFGLGFISSLAEPDLTILAIQVEQMTLGAIVQEALVVAVSIGVGAFLALGIYRILKGSSLKKYFLLIYILIFALAIFASPEILAIAFDASGSTTGSVTVPFILAFASGAASLSREEDDEESSSFGLLGIVSAGATVAFLTYGILSGSGSLSGGETTEIVAVEAGILASFFNDIPGSIVESLLAIGPLLAIFLVLILMKQIIVPRRRLIGITIGIVYIVVGLSIFLVGVNQGFLGFAFELGFELSRGNAMPLVVLIGGIIGMVSILAEPSVHVLNDQILDETSGAIPQPLITASLSIGVGLSVVFSLLRIILPWLQLWHILLPLLIAIFIAMRYTEDFFVGLAFDSGGVAAGTMTATFILPFAQGVAAFVPGADVVLDGFGVIAIVSITPILVLELMGIFYERSLKNNEKEGNHSA